MAMERESLLRLIAAGLRVLEGGSLEWCEGEAMRRLARELRPPRPLCRVCGGSVPDAIAESAKIDGAGPFTIFIKIVQPVLKPGLATVG